LVFRVLCNKFYLNILNFDLKTASAENSPKIRALPVLIIPINPC
jgi:hypothetical protein